MDTTIILFINYTIYIYSKGQVWLCIVVQGCERCFSVQRVMNDREGLNTEPAAYFTVAESRGIEHCSDHSQLSIIQPNQILNPAITSLFYHARSHAGAEGSLITMKATFVHSLNRPLAVYGKLQPHLFSSLLPQQPTGSNHFKCDMFSLIFCIGISVFVAAFVSNACLVHGADVCLGA